MVPVRPRRALHLVDHENLAGTADTTPLQAKVLSTAYATQVGIGAGDQVIVATSHHAARCVWFAWPHARRLIRSGKNGADLALLEVLAAERIAERFEFVILASGDGIFADPCAGLQAAGCQVTVVARPGSLSRRLGFAVRTQIVLNTNGMPVQAFEMRSAA